MEDTGFFFLRGNGGPKTVESTAWSMVCTANGPGEAGSAARARIVERYQGLVFSLARHLSRSSEVAKDIAQDFAVEFLDAAIYTPLDEEKGSFRAFLKEWTRNRVRAAWQRRTRLREQSDAGVEVQDPAPSAEETFDLLLTRARVAEARRRAEAELAKSCPDAWRVFDLWFFRRDARRSMTQAHAAEELGMSLSWFKTLLERGKSWFLWGLAGLLSKEERDNDRFNEELGATMEHIEALLARHEMTPADDPTRVAT